MRYRDTMKWMAVVVSAALAFGTGCKMSGESSATLSSSGEPGAKNPGVEGGGGPGGPGTTTPPKPGVIARPPGEKPPVGGGSMDDVCKTVSPGESPLHRLTVTEYKNTIQAIFPGEAFAFDTISKNDKIGPFYANVDTSVMQLLAEQYRTNAEEVSARVDANLSAHLPCVSTGAVDLGRVEAESLTGTTGRGEKESWLLWSNGYVSFSKELKHQGEYEVSVRAWGSQAGDELPKMDVTIGGEVKKTFDVPALSTSPKVYTFKTTLAPGNTEFRVSFTNDFSEGSEDRNLWVDWIDVKALGVSQGDRACAESFVKDFGPKAWRRPLAAADEARFMKVYDQVAATYGFHEGIRAVIEAGLQAPQFIYRTEHTLADDAAPVRLVEPYDMASRLSYFLWDSVPDEALLQAAAAGELETREQVEAQARRMVKDPKARGAINDALLQLLGLTELDTVDRQDDRFSPKVRDALSDEAYALVDEVVWEGDGKLSTLLSADFAYVSTATAQFYGVPAPQEKGMKRVNLNTRERLGILTHPAILMKYGYGDMPIHRGLFVWETFYCSRPPNPPDNLEMIPNVPKTFDGQSQRQKAEDRLEHPVCGPCHDSMDRIGLTFDMFDELGAKVEKDRYGTPVNDSGALKHTKADDRELDGPVELAQAMASSAQVKQCFSTQWVRYATGRFISSSQDACTIKTLESALSGKEDDILEIFVALTTTDAFRYRQAVTGQAQP